MVDDFVMVKEHFFLQAPGGQDGEGGGGVDEIPRAAREDRDGEGQDGECEISQSRKRKSPQVKTKVARTITPSKKRTSVDCASPSKQASSNRPLVEELHKIILF